MLQVSELGVRVERKLFLLNGYQVFPWLLVHFYDIVNIFNIFTKIFFH